MPRWRSRVTRGVRSQATSAHTETVTATGVGLDGAWTCTGLTETNATSHSLPWSFSNANYKSADETGTLAFTMTPAATTTTVTIYTGASVHVQRLRARRRPR